MIVFTFDKTLEGILTAVFDAFALKLQPEALVGKGDALPLFADQIHEVQTAEDKAERVWKGLEKKLTPIGLHLIPVSYLSEIPALDMALFRYICKVFTYQGKGAYDTNYSDPDVLFVRQVCHKVSREALHMKQFVRFQKAVDGTYLGVISPDHNVLPLVTHHFQDRFNDQPWLLYDVRRQYGYYYDTQELIRVTFEDTESLPFNLQTGEMDEKILAENDKIFQQLWRTYFKAICIKERMNPRKQAGDMPRRYWRYMTEVR